MNQTYFLWELISDEKSLIVKIVATNEIEAREKAKGIGFDMLRLNSVIEYWVPAQNELLETLKDFITKCGNCK